MKLLGRDFSPRTVLQHVAARLEARGLADGPGAMAEDGAEARVDPMEFNLEALAAHADATAPLPLETHRAGLGGRAVVLVKRVFRASCQVLINEALGRQTVFNGHVRDSYAQLASRLQSLELQLQSLRQAGEAKVGAPRASRKVKKAPRGPRRPA